MSHQDKNGKLIKKKVKMEIGELPLGDNEFTMNEILIYLNRTYRTKITQTKFTFHNIIDWTHRGSLPEAYGGNKITAMMLSGVGIYTVEGITRDDMRYCRDNVTPVSPIEYPTKSNRHPSRTELFYTLAHNKIKKKPANVIPKGWRKFGITERELGTKNKKLYK